METLLKEINKLLQEKNEKISSLEWWNEKLEAENKELKAKNEALENDVKMYKTNEELEFERLVALTNMKEG